MARPIGSTCTPHIFNPASHLCGQELLLSRVRWPTVAADAANDSRMCNQGIPPSGNMHGILFGGKHCAVKGDPRRRAHEWAGQNVWSWEQPTRPEHRAPLVVAQLAGKGGQWDASCVWGQDHIDIDWGLNTGLYAVGCTDFAALQVAGPHGQETAFHCDTQLGAQCIKLEPELQLRALATELPGHITPGGAC